MLITGDQIVNFEWLCWHLNFYICSDDLLNTSQITGYLTDKIKNYTPNLKTMYNDFVYPNQKFVYIKELLIYFFYKKKPCYYLTLNFLNEILSKLNNY